MSIKKYSSGSWVTVPYRKYETATDTITSLPKTIIGDGQNISAWSMKGNMSQSGTPTPSNPIYPVETGDKTANLWNGTLINGYFEDTAFTTGGNEDIFKSIKIYLTAGTYTISWGIMIRAVREVKDGVLRQNPFEYQDNWTITVNTDGYYGISFRNLTSTTWDNSVTIMINTGSTAKPYEPFGYKIPILSNGTTYPIYLSEPIRKISTYVDECPSTGTASRVIYKQIFTGQEDWQLQSINQYDIANFYIRLSFNINIYNGISSHFERQSTTIANTTTEGFFLSSNPDTLFLRISSTTASTVTELKNWLAAQYANGTPVTVWYVLATATTESFTAPTIPTSGTAQSFDVDTTLKPSEVSLTYHGWHEHEDTKFTSG